MSADDPGGRRRLGRGVLRVAEPLVEEIERFLEDRGDTLNQLERAVHDLIVGEGMPAGFNPESHLAPGLPRIRPVLVMLATEAAGGDQARTEDVAFSAELLQMALVVHDAALGRQGARRRRVALRLLRGGAHWLGGNHLTLRALEVARHAPTPEILGDVLDTLREISEGHALAEELRIREPRERDCREYAEVHTGAVFAFCTRAGGHLAGAPRPVVSALGRYGRHMGVAWHSIEDQWGLALPPEDIPAFMARVTATGRPMLPLIRALEVDPEVDPLLSRVLHLGEPEDGAKLSARILAAGGVLASRKVVVEETLAARRALRTLPASPHRDSLERLAVGLAASGLRPTSAGA